MIDLGDGLVIEILSPPREKRLGRGGDANSDSLVARVVWGDVRFLFTGDITAETEQYLLKSGQRLASDVLKVAHHGSNGSTTSQFLRAVDPAYTVISVGVDNQFGHPADAVLERIGELDQIEICRTDTQGTIEFITDGQRIWVESEK
jgi:competence protein ComEC